MKKYAVKYTGTNLWVSKSNGKTDNFDKARLYSSLGAIKNSIGIGVSGVVSEESAIRLENAEKEYQYALYQVQKEMYETKQIDQDKYSVIEIDLEPKTTREDING